jgi:hypothetical protein
LTLSPTGPIIDGPLWAINAHESNQGGRRKGIPIIVSIDRFIQRIWRIAVSPGLALALMGLLLAACVMGGLLPRRAANTPFVTALLAEPTTHAETSPPGQRPPALPSIPDIYSSRAMGLLFGLAAGVALLRMLATWVPSWMSPPPRQVTVWVARLPGDLAAAQSTLAQALSAVHMAMARQIDMPGGRIVAARRMGGSRWLPGLAYLGLLALLTAGWTARHTAWQSAPQALVLGQTRPLRPDREMTVRLEEIELRPRADGQGIASAIGRVVLTHTDREDWLEVAPHRPARSGALGLYMVGLGPAVRLSARNAAGQSLSIAPPGDTPSTGETQHPWVRVPLVPGESERLLAVPEAGIIVRLLSRPGQDGRASTSGEVLAQVLRGADGRILQEEVLTGSVRIAMDGATLDLTSEYYVMMRAEYEPELPLAAIGSGLLLAGLLGLVWAPPRGVWATLQESDEGYTCRLAIARHDTNTPWARTLKALLDEESHHGAK